MRQLEDQSVLTEMIDTANTHRSTPSLYCHDNHQIYMDQRELEIYEEQKFSCHSNSFFTFCDFFFSDS
jgi:hypothetical protein